MPEYHKEIFALRPWYHDFSRLGIQTDFRGYPPSLVQRAANLARRLTGRKPREYGILDSNLLINQRCKEAILIPFLQRVFKELPENPRCLELFCSDGYYSGLMNSMCPGAKIFGVDKDRRAIKLAMIMRRVLNYHFALFFQRDVLKFRIYALNGLVIAAVRPPKDVLANRKPFQYDLVFCAGGLYHLEDPRGFIQHIRPQVGKYLILQTVVTLESEDSEYFITPAPGWKHGSRFTHAAVKQWLTETGFTIVDEARNELEGNERLCDRGSSYFLCGVE
jgi:hypothetical protein